MRFAHPRRCLIATSSPAAGKVAAQQEKSRQFALDAARLAAQTRCHEVVLLDVRGISPVTDYMILATGTSPRQMRTVCQDLAEMAAAVGQSPIGANGMEGETWMLIDFVDVVVHVFSESARAFYDLDGLWGDAPRVSWDSSDPPASGG